MDGTPASEAALPHALGWAARCQAELWLVTVCDPAELPSEQGRKRLDLLNSMAVRLRAQTRLLCGSPAEEIVREAAFIVPQLIAIGTRPCAGVGGIANQVLRQASCPVLVVRDAAGRSRERLQAALAGDFPGYRRILLPLDGTPAAERSLRTARALAAREGAEVTLLRAQDEPDAAYLDGLAERLGSEGCPVHTRSVPGGLGDQAAQLGEDDLVILTARTHPVTGGATIDDVVRRAACPVLLLRAEPAPELL